MKSALLLAAGLSSLLVAAPACADIVQSSAAGFDVKQVVTIDVSIDKTWATLLQPATWWDHDHTYSDDSANLSLDPRAGGCFCEKIPKSNGAVEHARVVYIQGPQMLRMTGSLGPLQAEAVTGTLTFRLEAESPTSTRVTLDYIVGGYVRAGADTLAPKVDEVLATQLIGLKAAAEGPSRPSPEQVPTR